MNALHRPSGKGTVSSTPGAFCCFFIATRYCTSRSSHPGTTRGTRHRVDPLKSATAAPSVISAGDGHGLLLAARVDTACDHIAHRLEGAHCGAAASHSRCPCRPEARCSGSMSFCSVSLASSPSLPPNTLSPRSRSASLASRCRCYSDRPTQALSTRRYVWPRYQQGWQDENVRSARIAPSLTALLSPEALGIVPGTLLVTCLILCGPLFAHEVRIVTRIIHSSYVAVDEPVQRGYHLDLHDGTEISSAGSNPLSLLLHIALHTRIVETTHIAARSVPPTHS